MRLVVAVLLVAGLLGACGGDDTVPVPRGVRFQLEQTRQDFFNRQHGLTLPAPPNLSILTAHG